MRIIGEGRVVTGFTFDTEAEMVDHFAERIRLDNHRRGLIPDLGLSFQEMIDSGAKWADTVKHYRDSARFILGIDT